MHRCWLMGVVAPCMLVLPSVASAQQLGSSGQAIFAAERIFGIRGERIEFDPDGEAADAQVDGTTISFGGDTPLLVHNTVRLGFDYMIVDKVSLGGNFTYSTRDTDVTGSVPLSDYGESSALLVGARVGYLHMFGRVLGFWPRGGFVYHSTTYENSHEVTDLGVSLEVMLPIVVAPHFGFLPGFSYDQSFMGKVDPDNADNFDYGYRSIAFQVGLFGWL